MKKSLYIFFILFNCAFSQTNDPNLWQEYLPYSDVNFVLKSNNNVLGVTPYSMFSLDTDDNSIQKHSKINSLSDFGITAASYNEFSNKVVLGYSNGNIDFFDVNKTVGQPAIKLNSIIGDKTIYHIYSDDSRVYFSTGFGIVVVDAVSMEVLETYIIGDNSTQLKTNAVTIDDTYIYAATENGLKRADKNNSFLSDSDFWSSFSSPQGDVSYKHILVFQNRIYLLYKPNDTDPDTIYYHDGTSWNELSTIQGYKVNSLKVCNDKLVITTTNDVWIFDASHNMITIYNNSDKINDAIIDEQGILWIAGAYNQGVIKVENSSKSNFYPIGPLDRDSYSLSEVYDGKIIKSGGGIVGGGGIPLYNTSGFASYDGLVWKNYSRFTNSVFEGIGFSDFMYVSINPKNTKQFASSTYNLGGLFHSNDDTYARYDESNSPLYLDPSTNRYNLADVAFDNNQNLWVVNSYSPRQLHVKNQEGEWNSFSFGSSVSTTRFSKLLIDSRGYKWIVSPGGEGVIVFDDANTPFDNSDDRFRLLSTGAGSGNLPTDDVWSIEEDLSGVVWVGTSEGPAAFFNAANIFEQDSGSDAQQLLINQNGTTEVLLGAERITAIEIDGANRKWFGTNNSGIFVYDTEKSELIARYTVDNSPLFSNTINDIKINHEVGLVYIATTEGMLSVKSDATMPDDNFLDVYAYPNPVNPNYQGNIYINGLMLNSSCKITDVEGNLVKEVQSLGGQATWDGTDLFGNKVKSGIYLVFLANSDGAKTEVTKVMIIR